MIVRRRRGPPTPSSRSCHGRPHGSALRKARLVATEQTLEGRADTIGAARRIDHARPIPERRAVVDVLMMEAGQLGDPIGSVVGVDLNDRADHPAHSPAATGGRRDKI